MLRIAILEAFQEAGILIPSLQRAAPCAVVVLTSLVDERVAQRALDLGAVACLHKTAPATALLACVAASRLPLHPARA